MSIREQNMGTFGARVGQIEKDHAKARRRELRRISRSERVPGSWFPLGKIMVFVGFGLVLKALFMSTISEGAYRGHILRLSSGNMAEQAASVLLAPDPFSKKLSSLFEL